MATLDLSNPKHAHAEQRLRENLIIWLSSVRPDGRAHLVPVWYLWDGATILIFSQPDQKVRNLQANPHVSLALDDSKGGDDVVMINGEAALLPAGEIDTTYPAYAAKYAPKLAEMGWNAAQMATTYSQAIRITPTKLLVY